MATSASRRKLAASALGRTAALLAALLSWHLFAIGPGKAAGIPTPVDTFANWGVKLGTPDYWAALGNTLWTSLLGLIVTSVIAIPLGLIIGAVRVFDRSTRLLIDFFRFVPAIALLPLILLLFGSTRPMAIVLIVIGAIWPLLVQATYSVKEISPLMRSVSKAFHLTTADRMRYVYAPATMPFILTGFRIAATISLLMAISAEFLGGADGLGRRLFQALQINDPVSIFVYALTTALLGVALSSALLFIQNKVLFWHPSVRAAGGRK
ncbi:MAG: ABC transporter permease subunit [Propionibacteriaceae bacterium]|nr:ABC transporter permease subunit [Propionibacteriaceae bacterium]